MYFSKEILIPAASVAHLGTQTHQETCNRHQSGLYHYEVCRQSDESEGSQVELFPVNDGWEGW